MDAEVKTPADQFGREYAVGDIVAKAEAKRGHPGGINIRKVVKIREGKVYLDGFVQVALRLPERCMIITDIAK